MAKNTRIVIRQGTTIGEPSAEDDEAILRDCFVNLPSYKQLMDMESAKCIALGRTGSGKSALISDIKAGDCESTYIDPKEISLEYVSNTNIIKFLIAHGINLSNLFEMMWKHIFLIKSVEMYFSNQNIFDMTIRRVFERGNPARKYFEKYKDCFWKDSDVILKELSEGFNFRIQESLAASLGVEVAKLSAALENTAELSKIQKTQIENRTKEAVTALQLKELGQAIDSLNQLMDNKQKQYYLLVDDLDLDWADQELRYSLIFALISVLKPFRKVRNVKIICALRADLYEKIMMSRKGETVQPEKFEGLISMIKWSKSDLLKLAEQRINFVFKKQYERSELGFTDIFPNEIRKRETFDYLVERTQMRPRDLIAFINEIFASAVGSSEISPKNILEVEPTYSRKRTEALCMEWASIHPKLEIYMRFLRGKTGKNELMSIGAREIIFDLCLEVSDQHQSEGPVDEVERACEIYSKRENSSRRIEVAKRLLSVLYKVGAVELKLAAGDTYLASYRNSPDVDFQQISEDAAYKVCPMFWRYLGITPNLGK